MKNFDVNALAWDKMQGLIPAIVQDNTTGRVLMLAYMNKEALTQTLNSGWVTFYSRSKEQLWVKGASSGHRLQLVSVFSDCDQDTLLIMAAPQGPSCHTGDLTCFGNEPKNSWEFINQLEQTLQERKQQRPKESYTTQLFEAGISRIAQKVGEEGVEVALAAVENNKEKLIDEIADLIFHVLVLLQAQDLNINAVIQVLQKRHNITR